jgi:hypothetical protein
LTTKPIPLQVTTGSVIYSTHTAELPIPFLPLAPCRLTLSYPSRPHSFTCVHWTTLRCRLSCRLRQNDVVITLNNQVLMLHKRHPVSRLWHLTIPPPGFLPTTEPPTHSEARQILPSANLAFANAARLSASPAELVAFAHASLFSPSLSTLCIALGLKHVTGFPGLTYKLVRKYHPQSIATAMGHMDQSQKNQRSTKPKPNSPTVDEPATDTFPTSPTSGIRTHHVYIAISDPNQTGKTFSDQTGRFIILSSTGSTQLFILYDYD